MLQGHVRLSLDYSDLDWRQHCKRCGKTRAELEHHQGGWTVANEGVGNSQEVTSTYSEPDRQQIIILHALTCQCMSSWIGTSICVWPDIDLYLGFGSSAWFPRGQFTEILPCTVTRMKHGHCRKGRQVIPMIFFFVSLALVPCKTGWKWK